MMLLARKIARKLISGYRKRLQLYSESLSVPQGIFPPTEFSGQPKATPGEFTVQPRVSPVEVPIQIRTLPIAPVAMPTKFQSPMEVKGSLEMMPHKREIVVEGFEIPEFLASKVRLGKLELKEEKEITQMIYPLIPKKPEKREPIFAFTKISWDRKSNRYLYQVVEPRFSDKLKILMVRIKELLEQRLDIDFSKLKKFEAKDYLHKEVDELLTYFGFNLTETEREIFHYYIERDFIGLGKIEPFMSDEQIEDVSCDGVGIPIFVFHRNPNLGSMMTNISFDNAEELDSFVTRLAQLAGKSISVASPLVDGSLPDGSRLQATLATDIARRGSNFTIRKFTEEPLTPIHLLNYETIDIRSLAFLWLAVDFGRSILVSGGTASGKTSLLNVLSLFIRPEKKIVSIEDTSEIKLPHSHWIPQVARTPIVVEEGKRIGEVDLFDLLKESLRQRPDYIIVGEVRGKEAYVLFQQIATGHPSLATIHAENSPKLIDRLTSPPISLPASLIGSLDLIVFLTRMNYRGKFVRKVNEILEIVEVDPETKMPILNQVFKWNPKSDKFEATNKSTLLKRISDATGITEQQLNDELIRRMLLLNWMKERNVINYKDIYNIFNMYYNYPQRVLSAIMGES